MGETFLWNDEWYFTKENDGIPKAPCGEKIHLPHTWNAFDGQDGGNDYYRGTCWYSKEFPRPLIPEGGCAVLEFEGAAMTTRVYLNGKELKTHRGGYAAFRVDLTDALTEENLLAVSVDNSENDTIYPQKADFTFYGGIYRNVKLLIVPPQHFALPENGAPALKVTPVVTDLKALTATVRVEAIVVDAEEVTFRIEGQGGPLTKQAAVRDGKAQAVFEMEQVRLWDGLEDPYLYTAGAVLGNGERTSARFGIRSYEIDARQGFILNGRSYPLRGVSRHQDREGIGNALTLEQHRQDMELIREIGANTVRLAHYQHAQEFYDLCDENGIIVWAEIPYITMHMANGRANALQQMEEMILQNYNHPGIVVWGLSNEITAASAVNEDLLEVHQALNDLAHTLDPTRKTVMAEVFMLETDSPILGIPDVNSYNLYFGWYLGDLEQNDEFFDEWHGKYPDMPIGLSEYGADANPQYQSAQPEKGDYTESYQCVYHEHMAKMIQERPWLWATHVWNMFDFAADGRDEGGKHGVNQKGLVTFDRKTKKDAFYLYKAYWSKEPFVHICGGRYVDRPEAVTGIRVYSNLPEVTLYKDGQLFEQQHGEKVFVFQVPIEKEHSIEAEAGGCKSVILIRKTDAANPEYAMANRRDVTNWFDQDLDEHCWSVKDNMAEVLADPQAGPVLQNLMDQAAASRGDVAMATKDNANLQAMMARAMKRMTVESMLKQAGISEESLKQLNRVLQAVQKPV